MKLTSKKKGIYAAFEARPDVLPVTATGDAGPARKACIRGGA